MDSDCTGLQRLVGASVQWAVPLGRGKARITFRKAAFSSRREALAAKK